VVLAILLIKLILYRISTTSDSTYDVLLFNFSVNLLLGHFRRFFSALFYFIHGKNAVHPNETRPYTIDHTFYLTNQAFQKLSRIEL
jgi:hypothetical protein